MSTPARAAWIAAALVMTGSTGLAYVTAADDDAGVQIGDVVGAVVLIGGPPAAAVWIIVWHAARVELAAAAGSALRAAWTRTGLLVAATVAAGLAVATFVTSRVSLSGDRTGSLFLVVLIVTPLVLLVVACGVGYVHASFPSGVGVGFLAALGALVGILAVAIPEGARWAVTAGVFILDGDAPVGDLTPGAGALDALQSTLIFGAIAWPAWPVIGAALGGGLRRRVSGPAQ